jgi:hypothetical protein
VRAIRIPVPLDRRGCERPEPGGACQAGRPGGPSRGHLTLALFTFLLLFRVNPTRPFRRARPTHGRSGVRSPAVRGAVPKPRTGALAAPRAGIQASAPAPPAIPTGRSRSPSGGSRAEWGRQTSGWGAIYLKVGQYGLRDVALRGLGSAPSSPGGTVPRVGARTSEPGIRPAGHEKGFAGHEKGAADPSQSVTEALSHVSERRFHAASSKAQGVGLALACHGDSSWVNLGMKWQDWIFEFAFGESGMRR